MEEKKRPGLPMVFPCSGAADTGAIADGAARWLARHETAKMFCLAGIGAKVERIVTDTEHAEKLIALDGCDNDCSRKILEAAGFKPALHVRITDLGMEKGRSPATLNRIRIVIEEIERQIDDQDGVQ